MDLGYYFGVFLRRLPLVVVLTAIGSVVGIWLALSLPASYRSEAVMIVESEQIPDELAASTVSTGELEALQIIQQRILTRAVLLDLANEFDIYRSVPEGQSMTTDDRVGDMRDRLDIQTIGGSSLRGPAEATIVRVSFRAPSGQLAAQVTNEIVTLMLQENVEMRTAVAGQTLDFFTEEVGQLEQGLSEISARILDFQESNLQALPDSLEFRRSQQATLQERLAQLEREENSLRDRRDRMQELFDRTGNLSLTEQGGGAQRMTPQEARLQDLKDEYSSLSGVLSQTNPRLSALNARIESLESTINQRRTQDSAEAAENAPEQSREASMFDIQMSDIDTQIEYIGTQRQTLEAQMAEIVRTIEQTPGNSVTLDSLQREYANLQTRYNQAVANRARAETGSMIESLSKGRRITVVEQAVPPTSPNSPNRPLVAAAGFGGGLGLGLAIVLLLELLNAAIRRPQDLQNSLGIEPIATLPYIKTRGETQKRRGRGLAVGLAVLLGVPLVLWIVDQQVTPLMPIVEDLLSRVGIA